MQPAIPSPFPPAEPAHTRPVTDSGRTYRTIPTYIYAVVFASLCIVWGLLWDIMWHMSIGRDGLFSPPHVVIYVGAVVSGLFSGFKILQLTFRKHHPDRAGAVRFWGIFYGSLGALYCVWGAIAMLTSAPFDDWWHNTYGLDVQILTPPHTVLALGMMMVQFGAMTGVLALQNQLGQADAPQADAPQAGRLKWLFAVAAGLLLSTLYTLFSENISTFLARSTTYYVTAAIVFPIYLIAVGRGSMLRWPMTTIALIYLLAVAMPSWIIQFLPATPRLGPVLNPITSYQPFNFPLLLVVPALALDWLMRRYDGRLNDWVLAALLSVTFVLLFSLVQWYFAGFLHTSPLSRNGFFLQYSWTYDSPPDWPYRYQFHPRNISSPGELLRGLGIALVCSYVSARIGLRWGNWMRQVQR